MNTSLMAKRDYFVGRIYVCEVFQFASWGNVIYKFTAP